MEKAFFLTDDLLWDYADGFLTGVEKQQVEEHLSMHPEWQTRLQLILNEKRELAALPMEAPSTGFTDRVMAAWAVEHLNKTAEAKGNDWVIRLIAVVFVLFVLTPAIVMVVAALQMPASEIPALELPQVSLPVVQWDTWLSSPVLLIGLMLIFVFFGLRFLDKFLLQRLLLYKVA